MDIAQARDEFRNCGAAMRAHFYERDHVIQAMFVAFIGRQHLLQLGPPGVAKSDIVRKFAHAITNDGSDALFELLMTKFSTMDDVFGQVKVSGLKEDKYARKLERKAASSRVVILDEIFKSNSAILNALLMLINEGFFDDDGYRLIVPLEILVGMSNEMPEDESLAALYDRFLIRLVIPPLAEGNLEALMSRDDNALPPIPQISTEAVRKLRAFAVSPECRALIPPKYIKGLINIRADLAKRGIEASDRRWKRIANNTGASMALGIDPTDYLPDMLWSEAEQIPTVQETVRKYKEEMMSVQETIRPAGPRPITPPPAPVPTSDFPYAEEDIRLFHDTWQQLRNLKDPKYSRDHAKIRARLREAIPKAIAEKKPDGNAIRNARGHSGWAALPPGLRTVFNDGRTDRTWAAMLTEIGQN